MKDTEAIAAGADFGTVASRRTLKKSFFNDFLKGTLAPNTPLGSPEVNSGLFYAMHNFSYRKIALADT